jgi:hypothetical protein
MLAGDLSDGGRNILPLKGKTLRTRKEKVNRFKTYSILDGVPLAANVYMNPVEFGLSLSPSAAKLTLGDHEIAKKLGGLGLSDKPVTFQYMPVMEAILFGARTLMDD